MATLFNGSQAAIFPNTTSASCLSAMNTSLSCDPVLIQLLPHTDDVVGWTTSSLNTLCTSACNSSLNSLYSSVSSACGSSTFPFNNANMTFTQVINYYQYKWGLTCLKDTSSSSYCLDVEKSWNISQMVAVGNATWPTNTTKIYPDFSVDDWSPQVDQYGNLQPVSVIFPGYTNATAAPTDQVVMQYPAAVDYYAPRPSVVTDTNYGWGELDADEYPLQIQCSSCFLNRMVYTFSSVWGDIYDEVSSQIWSNIQANCKISTALKPANNLTGQGYNTSYVDQVVSNSMNGTEVCARYITPPSNTTSCNAFALANSVPIRSLIRMNGLNCVSLNTPPYCAPSPCPLAVNPKWQPTMTFVSNYTNFTLSQFRAWNPWIDMTWMDAGDTVCVGPPGGVYLPATATQANPSIYTTTATPAAPTVSGTFKSCGNYYNVSSGDYCNSVALKFSLTFSQLVGLNPSLNCNCTNLYLGYDYCIAPVNGTAIPSVSCTPAPTATTTTTSASSTTAACKTYATAPAPTVSGTTSQCCKYYTVQSGDSCYSIEQTYGITFAQFQKWNTQVDTNCDNIYPGDAYCVSANF